MKNDLSQTIFNCPYRLSISIFFAKYQPNWTFHDYVRTYEMLFWGVLYLILYFAHFVSSFRFFISSTTQSQYACMAAIYVDRKIPVCVVQWWVGTALQPLLNTKAGPSVQRKLCWREIYSMFKPQHNWLYTPGIFQFLHEEVDQQIKPGRSS